MMKKIFSFGLVLVLFTLFLVACNGSGEPTNAPPPTSGPAQDTNTPAPTSTLKATATLVPEQSTATSAPTETPEMRDIGPGNYPANVNPLTGQVVSDVSLLDRWPVAVKVNLVPRGYYRPPWGLGSADIVYDYYHNDGYSRLHAIFYGNEPELVGAVRSARLLDVDLIRMYKTIFAYGSADQRINDRLFNAEFSDRLVLESKSITCPPTDDAPMCRYDPSGYDLLLTGPKELRAYIANEGVATVRPNLEGMSFSVNVPDGSVGGGQEILTRYSSDNYSLWKYDSVTKRYLRLQDKAQTEKGKEEFEPLYDRLDDSQISAANVIVVMAPHTYFAPPPGEIVEILLSGKGKAYAFRDGQAYEVFWNRPTVDSVLYLTFEDGSPYEFKPGNTWVQVINDYSEVSQPIEDTWRFDFLIP